MNLSKIKAAKFAIRLLPLFLLLLPGCQTPKAGANRAKYLLGYTEMRCDDLRGQFYNWRTRRAIVIRADGSKRREIGASTITNENCWTSFVSWWPDGRAVINTSWESPENYAWEKANRTFRMTAGNWLTDCCLADLATGGIENVTAVERVSNYNPGLAPWPGDPARATFAPLINEIQHPFAMDSDGRNKKDLSSGADGFTYACNVSPDGQRITYNKNYQVYIAEKDGSNPRRVDENPAHPFQFVPTFSPDGQWLMFLAGEHLNCHPHLARADGTGLRKLADRGTYSGSFEPLKLPDFHSSGSDVPVWSPDSQWVYYTAQVGRSVELMRVTLNGQVQQLTRSEPGTEHFYPEVSPDGRLVAFGRRQNGAAALFVSEADGVNAVPITKPRLDTVQAYPKWGPMER
ncbi:MAG: hypothetical protein ABIQ35_12680 [Verrucomicrobiota bacterium]